MMRRCDGMGRREAIRIGGLTAFGLTLLHGPQVRSSLAASTVSTGPKAKSCLLLWLDGGPSHLETFDVKPDAPIEVRGPFSTIGTDVPGTRICELLPRTAKITSKIAIIRSMTSPLGEHGLAHDYLLTGYKPTPVLAHPSFGSVLSKKQTQTSPLPPYVAIPDYRPSAGPGFLGPEFAPFAVGGDPSKPDFRVRDLDFYPGIGKERMDRRRAMVAQLEAFQQKGDQGDLPMDDRMDRAYRLVTSTQAKQAFDLSREKPEVREAYGPRTFGQSCLLGRRLIESGVPFVTINNVGWDTHENLVLQLKEGYSGAKLGVGLIPTFDMAFSTLVRELDERGLLDETLVVAMGEFGRTPKLNTRGGRDHWPRVFSVAMAGGGVRGGIVVGSSDAIGESPRDRPVTPQDLAHTIYSLLGIDPTENLQTSDGRSVPINQGGELIRELLT